jgi:translocation and assembly module TamA
VGPLLHQLAGARQELGQLEEPPKLPIVGPVLYALRGSGKNEMVSLLDRDQLSVDRERVVAYYRDHGYYDARVLDARVVPVGEGQVTVTILVEEGEPVRVTRIDVAGMEAAPEASATIHKPALRPGDVFSVNAYDAYHAQLKEALRNNGWADSEVSQEAQILPEEHGAVVSYKAEPGQRFRFGPIFVSGTGSVPREEIRRNAGDQVKPGDWFAENKLSQAQAAVFRMGVFGGVRVSRGAADAQRGIIPVVVAVREAPFRSVRLGPSLGVLSNNRVDLSGVAGWTHRNFLGDLRKLDLSLTAGYAVLLTSPHKEGPILTAAADFFQPNVWKRYVDLSGRVEVQRGLEQAYDYWAQRARLALPIHLTHRLTLVPSYNLEVYELSHVTGVIDPNAPTAPSQLLQSCVHNVCLLSYLEQRIEWDHRDDPINTRRGFYAAFAVQEGGHVGGYGYQYLRLLPEARGYWPLGERTVLAARARVGAFIPVKESNLPPIVARFESGGANSMRGYSLNRLSPMVCKDFDQTAGRCTSNTWVAVGGNGLAEYSLELRFPLRGSLQGAVFTDAGVVSYPSADPVAYRFALDPRQLQLAAGFGVRYGTPVGPLRVDFGFRLPSDFSRGVSLEDRFPAVPDARIDPRQGRHREPILAFHLNVGEAY